MSGRNPSSLIQVNRHCRPDREINLLLLGPTGVGKSTFINGFVNYLCNDTIDAAVQDPIEAVISSSFSFTDENNDDQTIEIGQSNEFEKTDETGSSCTQQCRSFVFPIGDRNLRIIDAPGVGDTRGLDQDTKNFHDILTYISQYEHLNGICILLKPNEDRLSILFRFCINELLRHIHNTAANNLIFIFTNARATFFKPGATAKILRTLLNEHKTNYQVEVPFSTANTFLLDNEPFRYLAIRRKGFQLNNEQTLSYRTSWDRTVQEYSRLLRHLTTLPLHAVSNTLSLNEAEQLIRKLARPIAETTKLIEQNIQLAQQHKENVLNNPQRVPKGIPQNNVRIVKLKHPRTVCVSEKCSRPIVLNNEMKIEYFSHCHEQCYLTGVVQESIRDPRLRDCEAINYQTGQCLKCQCQWEEHQHITYEYQTNLIHIDENSSLVDIDQRITDLRAEEFQIKEVYKKLAKFLHANAILPINDDIVEYFKYFIREEQMKKNPHVVQGLQQMLEDYEKNIALFKETLDRSKDLVEVVPSDQIFPLVGTLYHLPINGQKLREQVQELQRSEGTISSQRQIFVLLPAKANTSRVMLQLKGHLNA